VTGLALSAAVAAAVTDEPGLCRPCSTVVTERWINDADEYIIQLTCKEVPDAKWVRICKRIE